MNVKAKVLKVMDSYGFDHKLNIFVRVWSQETCVH